VNCHKVQSLISAYVDSELSGQEMLAIRQHLSRCAECNAEFQSLLRVKRALGQLGSKHPSPDLALRICIRLDSLQPHVPTYKLIFQNIQKRGLSYHFRIGWAVVCLGLLAALMVLRGGQVPNPASHTAYLFPAQEEVTNLPVSMPTVEIATSLETRATSHTVSQITTPPKGLTNWTIPTISDQPTLGTLTLANFR
jgi:hypothetical protein